MCAEPGSPGSHALRTGLRKFNGRPDDAARQALLSCCSSPRWAAAVAAGRPFPSFAELQSESDTAVAALTEADLRAALAGHPRIGGQPTSATAAPAGPDGAAGPSGAAGASGAAGPSGAVGWSAQEQAGVAAAGEVALRALADGNADYERHFGHIYLACATGRSAAELLEFLTERLGNDREQEWRVVAAELAKINRIRLRKLLTGLAGQPDLAGTA
jgi:2-oxo-4-hydroxy-4-carboxy-5-ureidoimidazoline decarboxylase